MKTVIDLCRELDCIFSELDRRVSADKHAATSQPSNALIEFSTQQRSAVAKILAHGFVDPRGRGIMPMVEERSNICVMRLNDQKYPDEKSGWLALWNVASFAKVGLSQSASQRDKDMVELMLAAVDLNIGNELSQNPDRNRLSGFASIMANIVVQVLLINDSDLTNGLKNKLTLNTERAKAARMIGSATAFEIMVLCVDEAVRLRAELASAPQKPARLQASPLDGAAPV